MRWWIEDMPSGYAGICQDVVRYGSEVSPRGQKTREILNPLIIVGDPTRALPVGTNRRLNPAIAAVEAAQLIAGVSDPALTVRVAPNMKQFMDGDIFYGAYGLRTAQQMPYVIDRLSRDPDTRQAVVTIWEPRDAVATAKDMPCTLSFVFMIRDDKLILTTTMRSNDVWWGLPYDVFQFTQLQQTVAACLGVAVGEYHHRPISLHAYERDVSHIYELEYNFEHYDATPLYGINGGEDGDATQSVIGCGNWIVPQLRARAILSGDTLESETPTERWYREKLAPFMG